MIKNLFAEPIYQAFDIISEEENQELIDESYRLQKITPNGAAAWDCRIYTTFTNDSLTLNPVFDNLHWIFDIHMKKFVEKIKFLEPISCGNSWLNITGIGDYQEQHIHQSYWFSSIYYMRSPVGAAPTRLKSPYENQMGEMYDMESEYNKLYTVEPVERSLVIFGSHIPHYVPSGKNMEDRITIASNWETSHAT